MVRPLYPVGPHPSGLVDGLLQRQALPRRRHRALSLPRALLKPGEEAAQPAAPFAPVAAHAPEATQRPRQPQPPRDLAPLVRPGQRRAQVVVLALQPPQPGCLLGPRQRPAGLLGQAVGRMAAPHGVGLAAGLQAVQAIAADRLQLAVPGCVGLALLSIDWGDGTAASAGTISANGSGGFTVSGTHTYAVLVLFQRGCFAAGCHPWRRPAGRRRRHPCRQAGAGKDAGGPRPVLQSRSLDGALGHFRPRRASAPTRTCAASIRPATA